MKKKFLLFALVFTVLAVTASLIIASCGGSSSSDYGNMSTGRVGITSYVGPGSLWTATLNYDAKTFALAYDSSTDAYDWSATGSFTELPSGFLKCTVESVTPTTPINGPTAGSQAYILDIPGMAILVKPIADGSNIIAMMASGTCPTSNMSANWVKITNNSSAEVTSSSNNWAGTFTYTVASGTATVPASFALDSSYTNVGGFNFTAATCSSGILDANDSGGASRIFLTPVNGAIVETSGHESILAFPSQTMDIASMAGTYTGLVFLHNSGDDVKPARGVIQSNGSMEVKFFSNVETGDLSTSVDEVATVQLGTANMVGSTAATGMTTGNLSISGDTSNNMICMAAGQIGTESGRSIIFCVGVAPNGGSTDYYNALFVKGN